MTHESHSFKYKLLTGPKHALMLGGGTKVHRVQALRDFGSGLSAVKAGDIGGHIEHERNLSQGGTCWVTVGAQLSGDAQVFGDAQVSGDAWVSDNALVYGDARLFGNAQVSGDARVSDNARVYGSAWVFGDSHVTGDARVSGNAQVSGVAQVFGNARVHGNAYIHANARVYGNARLYGNARVYDNGGFNSWTDGTLTCPCPPDYVHGEPEARTRARMLLMGFKI